jgi:hypothetical protein
MKTPAPQCSLWEKTIEDILPSPDARALLQRLIAIELLSTARGRSLLQDAIADTTNPPGQDPAAFSTEAI